MGIQINGQNDEIRAVDGSGTVHLDVISSNTSTFQNGLHVTGGSVGIGTDNPVNRFHATQYTANTDVATFQIGSASAYTGFVNCRVGTTGAGSFIGGLYTPDGSLEGLQGTNGLIFSTSGSNIERFRITSGGEVGIKTTAPAATLDVRGSAFLSPLTLTSGGSGSWIKSAYGAISNSTVSSLNNLLIGQNMRGYLNSDGGSVNNNFYSTVTYSSSTMGHAGIEFCYGGITKFYNDSAASTANATFTPIEKMRVTPSANAGMVMISDTGNTYSAGGTSYTSYGVLQVTGSSAGVAVRDSASGVYRTMYTNSSGNMYFWNGSNEGYLSNTGAWTNASDERLKQNIRPIGYGLTTALSLTPRHYEMIDGGETSIGFIAQEVEEIIPELVSSSDSASGYKGLDYGSLVAVAIKAIQELKEENDSLRARLDAAGI